MNLRQARLCHNDDELFETSTCPYCGQECYDMLTNWIKPVFSNKERDDNYVNDAPGTVLPSQS